MKRLLSVLMMFVICLLLTACNETQTPSKTEDQSTTESTTESTNGNNEQKPNTSTQLPSFLPEAPQGLKEVTRYERTGDGFYIVKEYFDDNGNRLEEHYYQIDGELGIFDCKIVAYNTVDTQGNLIKSEGHYISNPYYAARETVLIIEAIEHEAFDYKVLDEDGNITLYIKETKNANGDVILEEYFTKAGRLIRTEETDYREDGTVSAYRGKNARNELTYETLCNEKGDFISCLLYDETGRKYGKIYAEYHENGVIKAYKTAAIYKNGEEDEANTVTEFYEDGRILKHAGRNYIYKSNGKLQRISATLNNRVFDENGYLLSYSGSESGAYLSDITIKYSYDQYGRLTSSVTKNTKTLAQVIISYEYAEDGSVTVRTTNQYGITNNIIFTDAKGRIIQTEVHSNTGRTSHQTMEYDVYGNVIKISEYKKDVLKTENFYAYNEHGDLIKLETKSYSSSGVGVTSEEYEYFENGYVKSQRFYRRGQIEHTKVYTEDGGYTYTEYSSLAHNGIHCTITYDRYGNKIESTYFAYGTKDYDETVKYEYYPDDSVKKQLNYYNDLLQGGLEYDEDGNIIVEYKRDENGVVVKNVYTEGSFYFPLRMEFYHDDVYMGYVVWENFSDSNNLKFQAKYDANGEKVYYIEYDEEAIKPIKEEFYENGVLVSYIHQTYVMAGVLYKVETYEELKDGTVTKMIYEYDEDGKTSRHTTFVNGEQVSDTVYIFPSYYMLVISYDMNGNVIERKEFQDGRNLEVIYRYEYHSNGNMKLMTTWREVRDHESGEYVEFMNEKQVYNENGDILLIERYSSFNGLYETITYVYLENGKLDYVETINLSDTDSIVYYRYDEGGILIKTETFVGEKMTEYTTFAYHENGVLKETLTYSVTEKRNRFLKEYDEFGRLMKESNESYKNSLTGEYRWDEIYTYVYDENGMLTEKCRDFISNSWLKIYRYEYHENGVVSKITYYSKNREDGTERESDFDEFDEYGYKIY